MASRSAVVGARPRRGETPVGVPWGLHPRPASRPWARRWVGMFRAVVQIAVRARFHPRPARSRRGARALPWLRDDHPRHVGQPVEPRAEAFLRGLRVPATVDQHVPPVAVLIHGTPQGMPCPMAGATPLVHGPLVARPRTPALLGIGLSACPAPLPDRCVGDDDATGEQPLFDVPVAEAEAVVPPDAMTHNFGWKKVDHLTCIIGVMMPYRSRVEEDAT